MRANFLQLQEDADLAHQFGQFAVIQGLCNSKDYQMLMMAKQLFEEGDIGPLVFEAVKLRSWTDPGGLWRKNRTNTAAREAFDRALRATRRLQKATIPVGTTLDSLFSSPLVAIITLQEAFFRSLLNYSALDRILEDAMPVPTNSNIAITTAGSTGANPLEATWVPLMKFAFEGAQNLPQRSLAMTVVSNDLLRMGNPRAANLLQAELRNALVVRTDLTAFDILTTGLTPISSTSGDPVTDLRKAFAEIKLAQWSKPLIFVAPEMLRQMALMRPGTNGPPTFPDLQLPNGGTINGVPCMAVDALASWAGFSPSGDMMVVLDAAQIGGDAGAIDMHASNDASILMADEGLTSPPDFPVPGSPFDEPTAADMVSMFQSDSTAYRMVRWFSLQRARDSGSVACVIDCNYDHS